MPMTHDLVKARRLSRLALVVSAIGLSVSFLADGAEPTQLSEQEYRSHADTLGVVMLQINWGRQWKCGASENAQLESLTFTGPSKLELATPSRLMVENTYKPYALLVTPGKYVLTGFDVKVAKSSTDVSHVRATEAQLVPNGEPVGGTFSVDAGEIVYIGHIGLDCAAEPMPWRFYIETRGEFDRYVDGFRRRFPFLAGVPVHYRLMATKLLGQDHSLESSPGPGSTGKSN